MPSSAKRHLLVPFDDKPQALAQKRFSIRTHFELGAEDFAYRLDTGGSSRSCRIRYTELSVDRETVVERNHWWCNVGIPWALIAIVSIVPQAFGDAAVRIPIWLWLGFISYGV